ncbi:chromosomal replication initiator protein DnaA [Candidatus Woesebacteria bacterium RIFCSPHIGHO2_01_FULL_38_9b]|uniref:Chromosomal replication initiator protein DnaA n=1 Tax=Candidatus Woesebacteria bacterium RIFCSPHIGHO2_01_FULL_38_9b TaxID=1802493 RepID=A0A1F7XYS1_9BACT|nr:MAG: chromosomal replication initiator protein DnaA [Candidatus Woesebacteria bacterium RIFCSPHIGHO2_01_FULL_38_9b]
MEFDNKKIWHDILESIKVSVSPAIFTTWFAQTYIADIQKGDDRLLVEVGCASTFVKTTIETRYYGLVQDSLSKMLDSPCDIIFIVKDNPDKLTLSGGSVAPLFDINLEVDNKKLNAIKSSGLRQNFTFENFAVSSSNQMAHAAAEAVASDLGNAYNPLFIWGGVGIGKTHLMHAIGHRVIEKDLNTNIYCCTGEQFTNDIVEGIRNKSTAAVRAKYRRLGSLLVDDVQFLAGKDTVQEEFFHTFNALVSEGSQVILTSDKPPSEISKLEERLKSRFEAGLIVDIAPPDFELRCAIVQIKAKQRGMEIPMDMVQLIAGNIETPRKIEGFLVRLSSEAIIKKSQITPELIESVIGKGVEPNGKNIKANPNDVINVLSKYFSLGKRSLLGSSRTRPVARPRQILMYILRTELGLPLVEVGRIVGGRDHTTVMHAVEKITHLASESVQIREDIRGIKNML